MRNGFYELEFIGVMGGRWEENSGGWAAADGVFAGGHHVEFRRPAGPTGLRRVLFLRRKNLQSNPSKGVAINAVKVGRIRCQILLR